MVPGSVCQSVMKGAVTNTVLTLTHSSAKRLQGIGYAKFARCGLVGAFRVKKGEAWGKLSGVEQGRGG